MDSGRVSGPRHGLMQSVLEARCAIESIGEACPQPLTECLELCQRIAVEPGDNTGRLRPLAEAVDDLRTACARVGSRLDVLREFLERADSDGEDYRIGTQVQWGHEGIYRALSLAVTQWDARGEDGSDGLTSLRYLLTGTSRVGLVPDCIYLSHAARAFCMYQDGESTEVILAYIEEVLEGVWAVREATCACREALAAADLCVKQEEGGILQTQGKELCAESKAGLDSLVKDVLEEMLTYPPGIRSCWLTRALRRMAT